MVELCLKTTLNGPCHNEKGTCSTGHKPHSGWDCICNKNRNYKLVTTEELKNISSESLCFKCKMNNKCPIDDGSDVEQDHEGNVVICPVYYKENIECLSCETHGRVLLANPKCNICKGNGYKEEVK